jgi:hypothetical protein
MRGGTSRGAFLLASDLPAESPARDAVLMRIMGSPDPLQLDGLGGGKSVTSKVAIVSASREPGADVDYLFAQVKVHEARVDTRPNCGNMLSGVGPFAIDSGLVPAGDPETVVRIFNVNTRTVVEAVVQTPQGRVRYEGTTRIDGVPEPAAPIQLTFLDAMGAVTGRLLPTGNIVELIEGIEVSCVDMAMPVVVMPAEAMGKSGAESPEELEADREFFARLSAIRLEAGRRMGLGDVSRTVVPKPVLVSRPRNGGTITSRYFTPLTCHRSHAATGALAVATAAVLPGSVASRFVEPADVCGRAICIEHPAGRIDTHLEVTGPPAGSLLGSRLPRHARGGDELADELVEVERFGDIVRCTELEERNGPVDRAIGGNEDPGGNEPLARDDALEKLLSAQVGKPDVAHHRAVGVRGEAFHRAGGAPAPVVAEAFELEALAKRLPHDRIVFHEADAKPRIHAVSPTGRETLNSVRPGALFASMLPLSCWTS